MVFRPAGYCRTHQNSVYCPFKVRELAVSCSFVYHSKIIWALILNFLSPFLKLKRKSSGMSEDRPWSLLMLVVISLQSSCYTASCFWPDLNMTVASTLFPLREGFSKWNMPLKPSRSVLSSKEGGKWIWFLMRSLVLSFQLGSTAIGIQTSEGIVLAVEKRVTSPLIEPASIEKIFEVDSHIGILGLFELGLSLMPPV